MQRMMKWLVFLAMAVLSSTAYAQNGPEHPSLGIGFRNTSAPLGIRKWFSSQKVGIDVNFGFSNHKDVPSDESLTDWTIEGGVPFVMRSWDRVHVLFRPGISYSSTDRAVFIPTPAPGHFDTESATDFAGLLEFEVEAFIVPNVSISGSAGLEIVNHDPGGGGDSTTNFSTIGNNATSLGFHVYWK